ncbi:MAG TPA: hypothetical protein VFU72_00895 [Nitrolancea sp.]|nr:hypothetical protein [Nitrolancea sp.]
MVDPRDEAAETLERLAAELELAARHCRTAAGHYRQREVPRASAHLLAAHGHLHRAQHGLDTLAEQHADHSSP